MHIKDLAFLSVPRIEVRANMSSQGIESYADAMHGYDPSKNTSRNVMTRYEKTKLLGMRMEQLARGAPACVDTTYLKNVRAIAMKELEERKLPLMIARHMPNGKKEYWRIDDMIV